MLCDLMLLYDERATEDITPSPPSPSVPMVSTSTSSQTRLTKQFRLRSCKFPDLMTCPAIWTFLHEAIRDLKKQHWHEIPSNLNTRQIKALMSLQKCSELVIKQSDKSGNIVLITHTQYQSMCLTVLNNPYF